MKIDLYINFVKQDFVDRYSGSILGFLWSFILPLVNILIFVLVFSKIMGARLESLGAEFNQYGYSIYLISGILGWTAFANSISRISNVFEDKAAIISKVKLSIQQLPLYIIATETIIFTISWMFFIIFLWLINFPISGTMFFIPLVFLMQQLLAYAIGFLAAIFSVFIKDVKEFVTIALQLWFWFTPIVYIVNILPEGFGVVLKINPMFHIMDAYRQLVIYNTIPNLSGLLIILFLSVLLLFSGHFIFKKLERDIRDII